MYKEYELGLNTKISFYHKIWMMSFLLGLGILGLSSSQDAYAMTIPIDGQTSCEAVPGGVWDTTPDFCTLTQDLTIEDGEILEIFEVFVNVPPGVTITIESGGEIDLAVSTLSNSGTILNSGDIRDLEFANLFNFGIIQNFGLMIIANVSNEGTINSCGGTESFFTVFTGNLVTSDCPCTPPVSGDWMINFSCQMDSNATVNGNLIAHNNKVLTVGPGVTLTVNGDVVVEQLSGIFIINGGTIIIVLTFS